MLRKALLFIGFALVLMMVTCSVSTGRGKALLNPVMRPLLTDARGWKTFVTLGQKAFETGRTEQDVKSYLIRKGFKKDEAPFYQSRICLWLASAEPPTAPHLLEALGTCRDAKMDFQRRYDNREAWSDAEGRAIYAEVVPDVYSMRNSEFPCQMAYAVYTFYDDNDALIEAIGYRHEAGCL